MTSTGFTGAARSPRSTGVELAAASMMVPVLGGSSPSVGATLEAAPLGGSAAKLHGVVSGASGDSTVGLSIAAGTDIAACSVAGRSMIQVSSLGDGNGLDSASGTATKNTRTPHNEPATTMAQ